MFSTKSTEIHIVVAHLTVWDTFTVPDESAYNWVDILGQRLWPDLSFSIFSQPKPVKSCVKHDSVDWHMRVETSQPRLGIKTLLSWSKVKPRLFFIHQWTMNDFDNDDMEMSFWSWDIYRSNVAAFDSCSLDVLKSHSYLVCCGWPEV